MTMLDLGFYGAALGVFGASFLFLSVKNPIHILLSFTLLIMQITALMMLLDATLVSLLFALFYATLIVIFLVFYMMTQNYSSKEGVSLSARAKGIGGLVVILLAGQVFFALVYKVRHLFQESPQFLQKLDASPHALGEILYGDYSLFVVYLGVLFFIGCLGVILMINPKKLKMNKQSSLEKINQHSNSVELRDLKFSEPTTPLNSDQKEL
jgi:NADH:ubiquinone oxidoreductase subunit 6 (subunit J)